MPLPKLANEPAAFYVDEALSAAARSMPGEDAQFFVSRAQVYATLLLAYEQAETNRILRQRFRIVEEPE